MARFIIKVGELFWKDSSRFQPYPWTFDAAQARGYEAREKAQEVVDYWNRVHYRREMVGPDKKQVLSADGAVRYEWSSIGGHHCRDGTVEEIQ